MYKRQDEDSHRQGLVARDFGIEEWDWPQGCLLYTSYTKLKREDTYESIRQLIDDIDSLKHIMFVFAFDRELLDNDSAGIKSYQALWMRIQNEIISRRFNRFTDIVDMDRLAEQEYTCLLYTSISLPSCGLTGRKSTGRLYRLAHPISIG